ncbi:MAG: cation:proton antiporter [Magnetospiraceae bacterium]
MSEGITVSQLVFSVATLLLLSAGVLSLSRQIRVPFTVALVVVGLFLRLLSDSGVEFLADMLPKGVSPEVILFVFLPTLVFESALNLDLQQLRRCLIQVLTLAVPGLILSTAITGLAVWAFGYFALPMALLLGAILSATDPVAVTALFKQLGAPKRLNVLVEGESLFNDATAIVVAHILLAVVMAGVFDPAAVLTGIQDFFIVFIGGVVVGWVMALVFGWLLGRVVADSFIEITLTATLAYLSFLVAEHFLHVSGVMATLTAALTLGHWGRAKISPSVAGFMHHFWDYMAGVSNALIFLLVGLTVDVPALFANAPLIALTMAAMILARAVNIYGLLPLVGWLPGVKKVRFGYQTVMFWGGLRGAIALAIVLSLEGFPEAEVLTAVVVGAVLFTLLVNGLTIEPLVRRLGLDRPPVAQRLAHAEGLLSAKEKALVSLPQLLQGGLFSARIAHLFEDRLRTESKAIETELDHLRRHELAPGHGRQLLYLRCFAAEKTYYYRLFSESHLGESAYRALSHSVDLQQEAAGIDSPLPDHTLHPPQEGWIQTASRRLLARAAAVSDWPDRWRAARVALEYEVAWGRYQGSRHILKNMADMGGHHAIPHAILEEVAAYYTHWKDQARNRLDQMAHEFPEFVNTVQEKLAGRLIAHVQADVIDGEARSGILPAPVAEELKAALNAEVRHTRATDLTALQPEPEELLRKVPFFRNMGADEFAKIAKLLHRHTLSEGDIAIRQGDRGDSLFLIARGVIRVSRMGLDDQSHDLATLVAGDFVGEMALLNHEPRSATCRAITPCTVYELRAADLKKVEDNHPEVKAALSAADRERRSSEDTAPVPTQP